MTKHRTISDFTKEQIIEGLEIKKLFLDDEMSKEDLLDYIYEEDLGGDLDKYGREDLRDILDKEFPLVEPIFKTKSIYTESEPSAFSCPSCETKMEYRKNYYVHAWICPDCPMVLFEYYDKRNIKALNDIIN